MFRFSCLVTMAPHTRNGFQQNLHASTDQIITNYSTLSSISELKSFVYFLKRKCAGLISPIYICLAVKGRRTCFGKGPITH